jgi:hypothetical protein
MKVKVKVGEELEPDFNGKDKIKTIEELKLDFYVKVKVKYIYNLQSTNSQIISKSKDGEEVGKELGIATTYRHYHVRCKNFLFYHRIQESTIPNYGASSSKKKRFLRVEAL